MFQSNTLLKQSSTNTNYQSSEKVYIPKSLDRAARAVLNSRPQLYEMLDADLTVSDYLSQALEWKAAPVFTGHDNLRKIIKSEIVRVHGPDAAAMIDASLNKNWAAESGSHISLPRSFDRITARGGRQFNNIGLQGQILWSAAVNYRLGTNVTLSLSEGSIPGNNRQSGAYIDYSQTADPIRIISNSKCKALQNILPALSADEIDNYKRELNIALKQKNASAAESEFCASLLDNMKANDTSLNDQLLIASELYLRRILPGGIRHYSIDSTIVGGQFIASELKSKNSLFGATLRDPVLREEFRKILVNIPCGWTEEQSMFQYVDGTGVKSRLNEYFPENIQELINGLESGEIIPRVLLKFAAMTMSGGLCLIGGMNQIEYCSKMQKCLVKFIYENFPEKSDHAQAISRIPLNKAVFTPCWGIKLDERNQPKSILNNLDLIKNSLTSGEYNMLPDVNARDGLLLALPSLYSFLVNDQAEQPMPAAEDMVNYNCIVTRVA